MHITLDSMHQLIKYFVSLMVNPPGRRTPTWKDNIKMDLQEVGCVGGGNLTESLLLRIGTGGGHL
jgi:hypothetical protein